MTDSTKRREPERKCIGCGNMRPKHELIRIVLGDDQRVVPDETGKLGGRGAYICGDPECLGTAKKRKALERSFKTRIDPASYDGLEEAVVRFETG